MGHCIELRARAGQYFSYSGRSLLVINLAGDVPTSGYYFENTRLLSRFELTANGYRLRPIAASPVDGIAFLAYQEVPKEAGVPERAIHVQIAHFLGGGLRTLLRIENCHGVKTREAAHASRLDIDLTIAVDADFAGGDEAEQGIRHQTAPVETTWDEVGQELRFRYRHSKLDRAVAIRVEQSSAPVGYENGALAVFLRLHRHQPVELVLAVEPIFEGKRHSAPQAIFGETMTPLGRIRRQLRDELPVLRTSNTTIARAWQTATSDLVTLPFGLNPAQQSRSPGFPSTSSSSAAIL